MKLILICYFYKFLTYNNLETVFVFQSGEKPLLFAVKRRTSDILINRGAYGLSLAGIFISFYGVYHMVQDTNTKKQ